MYQFTTYNTINIISTDWHECLTIAARISRPNYFISVCFVKCIQYVFKQVQNNHNGEIFLLDGCARMCRWILICTTTFHKYSQIVKFHRHTQSKFSSNHVASPHKTLAVRMLIRHRYPLIIRIVWLIIIKLIFLQTKSLCIKGNYFWQSYFKFLSIFFVMICYANSLALAGSALAMPVAFIFFQTAGRTRTNKQTNTHTCSIIL